MDKQISLQGGAPLNNYTQSQKYTKYLAVTLLVIGILAAAAALLFQFQFKSTASVIGFGVGSGVTVIASGVLFWSLPSDDWSKMALKDANVRLLSLINEWAKNKEVDEKVWKQRYALCQSYWEKFGINEKALVLLEEQFNNSQRQDPLAQNLIYGKVIEDSMGNCKGYSLFFGSLARKDLNKEIDNLADALGKLVLFDHASEKNQIVMIQGVKWCLLMGIDTLSIKAFVAKFKEVHPESPKDELEAFMQSHFPANKT